MSRAALVLRPAPANARTVERLAAVGLRAIALPLFRTEPRDWLPPRTSDVDAVLLTSANAVRHAGAGLAALAHLPVVTVGEATARAARAAGLDVALVGDGGAADVARQALPRWPRLLHLAGAEHVAVPGALTRIVYASVPTDIDAAALDAAIDAVVLLHSARAAQRFMALFGPRQRSRVRLAVLSPAVAAAAGDGWAACIAAPRPDDQALVDTAAMLAIDP